MLRKTCHCGEPKSRWRVRGAECRERIRLGYPVRPSGFWARYRDPALTKRTTGLRGAPASLTEMALQEPDNPVRDAIGQLHLEYMAGTRVPTTRFKDIRLEEQLLQHEECENIADRWRMACAPWPGYPTRPRPPR